VYGRAATRRLLDRQPDSVPPFFVRVAAAAWVAVLRTLPAAVAASVVFGAFEVLDLMTPQVAGFFLAVLGAVVVLAAVSALATAILEPAHANWRLIALSDSSAARLALPVRAIAAVFGIDLILSETIRLLVLPLSMGVALSFATSLALAALLMGVVLTPFVPLASTAPVARYAPRWLKVPLMAVALAIVAAVLFGYVALGRFLAAQVLVTGSVAVAAILLHLAIGAIAYGSTEVDRPVGRILHHQFGLDAERRSQLSHILSILLNIILIAVTVPVLVLSWGFSWADIRDWVESAVFVLNIGTFRLTPARLVAAVLLFTAVLLLTRFTQRWLAGTMLQPERMDTGIAHSIHTGVGYAGIGLAALIAVSYAGLDITNLAIVAGALSVGIGFGLQSIVGNFVSGLILLIERPIKVGDRIVVKGQEGYVRRISVRATELETSDRASLIVPNSELITGTVMNWTHRDAIGGLVIRVGVSYNADPDRVREILLGVAHASRSVLQVPKPQVALDNFGANALEFSVRGYLADINTALEAQTELRTAILKALRAAGIAMPYLQHDVHLRDLDWVRQAVVAALARARAKEVQN
ncbi:MAG: mechanosensitive ion channel family protein, partial [Hyphomicrobiaceae bacterium]